MKKHYPTLAQTLLAVLLMGCSAKRPAVVLAPPGVQPGATDPARNPAPISTSIPTSIPTPALPPPPQPALPPRPEVRVVGQDMELVGLSAASSVVWSPSWAQAVIQAGSGAYLLDATAPSLRPLPDFTPTEPPQFWSETEVAWMQGGRLQLRDLVSGQDRLLHDFGAPVIHELRPGDTRYVVARLNDEEQAGYRFGTIVTGPLNGKDETVVAESGYLAGRMFGGQVLAVAGGQPGGPLWSVAPSGQKQMLSKASAHFVQIAADGRRALWLTGPDTQPASAQPDSAQRYDPPLTDLWTWDLKNPPVRIQLGGTFSVRAGFSPDGSRIALAINEEFAGMAAAVKPGRVAVVENGNLRSLASFPGWVGIGMWLGSDGFRFQPPMEKTGAQAPIMRMDLTGKQERFSSGIWYPAGMRRQWGDTPDWHELIMDWGGKGTTVQWADTATTARVDFNPNADRGNLLYVPPKAPYLPFAGPDRLWLKRLTY